MMLHKLKAILRDDEVVEQISEAAHNSLRNHLRQVRGQMITPADSIELHVMHATIDALIREYEGYVCVPMAPEERRLDRLCFSPETGMPTREQARIIYQIVASD